MLRGGLVLMRHVPSTRSNPPRSVCMDRPGDECNIGAPVRKRGV